MRTMMRCDVTGGDGQKGIPEINCQLYSCSAQKKKVHKMIMFYFGKFLWKKVVHSLMPNLHYQIFFKGPLPQSRGQKGHEGRLQVHGCKTSVREAAFSIQVLTIYKCSDRVVGCVTSFCQGNIDRPTGCSLKIVFFRRF